MPRRPLRYHTFVVRIWFEPARDGEEAGEWRGRMEHVASGQTGSFRTLEGAVPVLRRLVEAADRRAAEQSDAEGS